MSLDEFDLCCVGLDSNKVTERRKNAELLKDLLNKPLFLQTLNNSNDRRHGWDAVFGLFHRFIRKEAEKLHQDEMKQAKSSATKFRLQSVSDTFLLIVSKANSDETRLPVHKLVESCVQCFECSCMKQYFGFVYLKLLIIHVLPVADYWGRITDVQWRDVFIILKELYKKPNNLDKESILRGLYLTIKYGSLHSACLNVLLQEQFVFMHDICSDLTNNTIVKLQLVICFSELMAPNYRMSVSKLGEEISRPLLDFLHQLRHEYYGGRKSLIYDYFLLQVRLHHPCGAARLAAASYAYDSANWSRLLRTLYSVLCAEVDVILRNNPSGKRMPALWPNFRALFVEVAWQVYASSADLEMDVTLHPPTKRRKLGVGVGVTALVNALQVGDNWPWLSILATLLEMYPAVVDAGDFLAVLETLATLQAECKDATSRHYLYRVLTRMVFVESCVSAEFLCKDKVDCLWTRIWETSLRSLGLNQNEETTHELISTLLKNKKNLDTSSLLSIYLSGVVNISEHSIRTLHVLTLSSPIPETLSTHPEINPRIYLIHHLMAPEKIVTNSKLCFSKKTAAFLVSLILKTNLNDDDQNIVVSRNREYYNIERIYLLTSFENGVFSESFQDKVEPKIDGKKYLINSEVLQQLNNRLLSLSNYLLTQNIVEFMNGLALLLNVASMLRDLEITFPLETRLFDKFFELFQRIAENQHVFINSCKSFYDLLDLKLNAEILQTTLELINIDFLKIFCNVLSEDVDETDTANDDMSDDEQIMETKETCDLLSDNLNMNEKLQLYAMRVLTCYACGKCQRKLKKQQHVLESLLQPDFNPKCRVDFQMTIFLLKSLINCEIGSLDNTTIKFILASLETLRAANYENYFTAIVLLQILKDAIPHINASNWPDAKSKQLRLLNKFIERKNSYGPEISIILMECLGLIIKQNVYDRKTPEYSDITQKLMEFFKSNFMEIRINSIRNIVTIKEETVLFGLKNYVRDSFTVCDNLTEEQLIDEATNRIASALHLYAALIETSVIWRKHFLFEFFLLIHEKKINKTLIEKNLQLIAKYLNTTVSEFLDENVEYLLLSWCKNKNIREFPSEIFHENKIQFYVKYLKYVAPILFLKNDDNLLEQIRQEIGQTIPEMLKECYPLLLAQNLPQHENIVKKFGLTEWELAIKKFHLVFMELLRRVDDLDHFRKQFNCDQTLPKNEFNFDLDTFKRILRHLELKMSDSESLIKYSATRYPAKLEKILLEATASIHEKQTIEDKFQSLHRYSILIDLITSEFNSNHNLNSFFIRSIVNNLMNTIKKYETKWEALSTAACVYFKTFARRCFESCSAIFEQFLILVVSTLTPIAKKHSRLSEQCVDVLNFLIVDNSKLLYGSIASLDPFPKLRKFEMIRDVYERIKYGNERFTLRMEVQCFLNVGNSVGVCDRADGLQHLKEQISTRKSELNELCAELRDLRGLTNSRESLLHQLVCMLVELTVSPVSEVKLEAARCLGELGPFDLTTLVLKPEKVLDDHNLTPVALIATNIIVSLIKLIVNSDVKTAKNASRALHAILRSREGNNVIDKMDKSYIIPFIEDKEYDATDLEINDVVFARLIDDAKLWCPAEKNSHVDWITLLVTQFLRTFPENTFFSELIPICCVNVEFAEMLLPLLIFLVLTLKEDDLTRIVSERMQQFFGNHWEEARRLTSSQNSVQSNGFVVFNRASVQCMLNVVHFIRLQQNIYQNNSIDELKLNYLHVALGAQFCSAYLTSVLYVELWCYNKLEAHAHESKGARTILQTVCENEDFEVTLSVENMLREAYKKIGDADAIPGCGTSYILNTKSRIDYYKNIGKWEKVALYYNKEITPDLIVALKKNGLYNLAFNANCGEDLAAKYECAWRLNNWSVMADKMAPNMAANMADNLSEVCFESSHYAALKSLNDGDLNGMKDAIAVSRTCVINGLSHSSLESSKSLYRPLTQLKMLQDLEDFSKMSANDLVRLLETWRDNLNQSDFEYVEPIKAQRITLMRMRNTDPKQLSEMYVKMAEEARSVRAYHVAQQSVDCATELETRMRGTILFEQAQLSWLDDKTSGRYLLKYILDNNQELIPRELYARALTLYGNWMVETRSENPTLIIENYFEKSLQTFNEIQTDCLTGQCEALQSLARFADAQYQQVTTYIASSSFESKLEIIKKSRDMAMKIKHDKNTSDERRAIALYEKQSKIDESEVSNAYQEKNMYLILAVKNYLRILELSDSFNFKIFRILSLSLDNKQNTDLLNILKSVLPTIAAYKFIPMLPQLVPHIATPSQTEVFEKVIQDLLERCARDHPHHTLPIILAVSDSHKDRKYDRSATTSDPNEPRVQAAKHLLNKLKKNKALTQIIHNMELVTNALLSLAYLDASKCSKRGNGFTIPRGETIKSIRNFEDVLVPTVHMQIRKNKNYNNIIGIQEFSNTFQLVGGVNAPKKLSCIGTDGICRTQLVKGKDDLRQDAVMQQVFSIMNQLLANDEQTRNLLIRTYKVVPLSQRSGVIEWCENTEPLGTYLSEAHRKYHPSDWSPNECRNQLRAVHAKDPIVKHRVYSEICARLRPVMHMFFISAYPQPTVWYEKRRAYMRSVATSSMVGYVLGLGDRHVHNILLDTTTAEVVHIDFGIAFEQGKCLPTPETVPFRLSRDIEAGMGVCGIEGVFRRSCEKTMQVLRQNVETVVTILEVLLYDPLYVWTITPAEAYSRQKDDEDKSIDFSEDSATSNVNITAERALLRLKEKLQGMENGAICSVEGQVELLLQQARDPVNLSRLFNGWQPYL